METTKHYKGAVKLSFSPGKHSYMINGEKAKGVTTVLSILAKPALIVWAAKMAAEYIENTLEAGVSYDEVQIKEFAKNAQWAHRSKKDSAADAGTMVHQWIQDYVEGKNPKMPVHEGMKRAIEGFLQWWIQQDVKVVQAEAKLCSPTLMLAGTADLVCYLNGKLTILDWKTGSGIYPEYLLQMGAYADMYEEEFGERVEQVGVINCSVRAEFSKVLVNKVPKLKQVYRSLLKLNEDMDKVNEILKGGNK